MICVCCGGVLYVKKFQLQCHRFLKNINRKCWSQETLAKGSCQYYLQPKVEKSWDEAVKNRHQVVIITSCVVWTRGSPRVVLRPLGGGLVSRDQTPRWLTLTLHDFCRATDQIGYDMKRWVIAEDRAFAWNRDLCNPPSRTTRLIPPDCVFPGIRRILLEIFEHVQNNTTGCDSLRLLGSWPAESLTTQCRKRRQCHRGPSQVVVSSKSFSARPA